MQEANDQHPNHFSTFLPMMRMWIGKWMDLREANDDGQAVAKAQHHR